MKILEVPLKKLQTDLPVPSKTKTLRNKRNMQEKKKKKKKKKKMGSAGGGAGGLPGG
jgi:hypothetical protein